MPICTLCQLAGRPLRRKPGRKVRAPWRQRCRITSGGGDPRESATESKPPAEARKGRRRVRVKGWGKSPPRSRQRERHGKPHREQDRIGAARGFGLRQVSGPAARVGCARRRATGVPEEWPSRGASRHTEPGLQASWHNYSSGSSSPASMARIADRRGTRSFFATS
jgi:hypothetical protein